VLGEHVLHRVDGVLSVLLGQPATQDNSESKNECVVV
jgi:hypothetical protein